MTGELYRAYIQFIQGKQSNLIRLINFRNRTGFCFVLRRLVRDRQSNNVKLTVQRVFFCFASARDRKSTRLNSSHQAKSRMPSSA